VKHGFSKSNKEKISHYRTSVVNKTPFESEKGNIAHNSAGGRK
jgi:hypothetical protein